MATQNFSYFPKDDKIFWRCFYCGIWGYCENETEAQSIKDKYHKHDGMIEVLIKWARWKGTLGSMTYDEYLDSK